MVMRTVEASCVTRRPIHRLMLLFTINVKKLQFIHTLTTSKTAKIKKLYTMPLHIDV